MLGSVPPVPPGHRVSRRAAESSNAAGSPRTLIAIPVFNELKHVGLVLEKVLSYHDTVLLVDDGSTDGTGDLLEKRTDVRVLRHRRNMGYGQSLIDAFAYADHNGFDWVLTMDCDEQHEPEMIPAFLDLIRDAGDERSETGWDLISGSRYRTLREDDDQAPQDRAAINACLTRLLNAIYPIFLTDSFCGFKAHRVSAVRRLALTESGYAFPMQLWPQVVRSGTRLLEMSVRRIYNDPKRSFGVVLDQPLVRLGHYMNVLSDEHFKLFGERLELPEPAALLNGTAVLPPPSEAAAEAASRVVNGSDSGDTSAEPKVTSEALQEKDAPCTGCCRC